MEDSANTSSTAEFLASLVELPKLVENRSPLEKSKIYQDYTLKLINHCQINSSKVSLNVEEEIDRIKIYFDELHLTRRGLEQAKRTWNPRKIYKRHRRHLQLAADSLKLLNATRNTSDSILRKVSMSSQESLISTTASFFTAVDYVTQNDMDTEDENNDDEINLESSINEDQSEEQVVAQVEDFARVFREMSISQASNFSMNQYIFSQSVVHQGSGSSTNSSVIVGGSNNRGGGSQYTTSSSQRST